MTKQQALELFRYLVGKYGLHWTARVPARAYEQMASVHELTTESERREALFSEQMRQGQTPI
jgi:hypothetical protein